MLENMYINISNMFLNAYSTILTFTYIFKLFNSSQPDGQILINCVLRFQMLLVKDKPYQLTCIAQANFP